MNATKRRILLVNPNVTGAITDVMIAEARTSADDRTELIAATAAFGTIYVENRVEAAIAAHAVLDAVAPHARDIDGVIVSAFGDPGVEAVRELLDVPVTGISESAFLTAHLLGRRHVVVCLTKRLGIWYRECAEHYGLDGRIVAVRALDVPPADITQAREECAQQLLALCQRAVRDDGAEVIIMGGGPVAGLARELVDDIEVPILDGVSCA
ncbi:MAG: allantoin racemase, partial [Rhodothermales bacterium]